MSERRYTVSRPPNLYIPNLLRYYQEIQDEVEAHRIMAPFSPPTTMEEAYEELFGPPVTVRNPVPFWFPTVQVFWHPGYFPGHFAECCVCQDGLVRCAFLTCRHFVCQYCLPRLDSCPCCRVPLVEVAGDWILPFASYLRRPRGRDPLAWANFPRSWRTSLAIMVPSPNFRNVFILMRRYGIWPRRRWW